MYKTRTGRLAVLLVATAASLVLTASLALVFRDAMPRQASQVSVKGFAYPDELRQHIRDEQRDSRHFWFKVAIPFHLTEAVALWLLLWRVKDRRKRLNWILFVTCIQFAAYAKLATGGWFILALFLLFYPLLFGSQIVLNIIALLGRRSQTFWPAAANLLFFTAVLMQFDIGDGYGWVTITAMVGDGPGGSLSQPPRWLPKGLLYNAALFVPATLCWFMHFIGARPLPVTQRGAAA